jgi:hypothetical protein
VAKSKSNALLPQEVADELRIRPRTVAVMCKRGEFVGAFKVGDEWRVPPEALQAFRAKNSKRDSGSASSEVA